MHFREHGDADSPGPGAEEAAAAYGQALFEPGVSGEAERIDLGALAYDWVSKARLRALGVGPGWRCLDVGAGTGSLARWLVREPRVDEVVAVDRDVRFLTAHPTQGVTPLTADVTAADFAPGRFDLVHARFLLMHLRQHQDVLARLADLVAPGGWLVIADAIDLTTDHLPDSPYRAAMRAMWRGLRDTIGTDVSWTHEYPHRLQAAGLQDVGAEIYIPPLTAGQPISAFWAQTWDRMREAMLSTGLVDELQLEAAVDSLSSPAFAALSPGMIIGWGRRQGARSGGTGGAG
jgi:SAM-dependent methyltransferase